MFISSELGLALFNGLTETAGSTFLGLLMIVMILIFVCVGFRLPVEFSAVFVLPLLIAIASYTSQIYPVLGVAIIYLGFLLGKSIINN